MASAIKPLAKPLPAIDVARCFIQLANEKILDIPEEGESVAEGISNLKLQKMLYFAQAAHLSLYDKPLFNDKIYAWKFGPVLKDVYHTFKVYRNDPIPSTEGACVSQDLKVFLDGVWNIFGKYSASELVNISHNLGPWRDLFREGEKDIVIDNEAIATAYRHLFVTKAAA